MLCRILQTCHDAAAKFVHLLKSPGYNYLVQEDFIPFLQVNSFFSLLPQKYPPITHLPSQLSDVLLLCKKSEIAKFNLPSP